MMDKETTINYAKDANTTNTMAKLNINNDKSNTTSSLKSDQEQISSQESTVATKTKLDHTKAQEIYRGVDPDKGFLDMIKREINDLPDCEEVYVIKNLASNFVHDEPNNVISFLEALYEYCGSKEQFTEMEQEKLFCETLENIKILSDDYNYTDLAYLIEDVYGERIYSIVKK
ncbi:unnamed protein product [Brachionus calyciflorus]|uniref:Uncharacterized protein n=1 Tax=Brachionus calyciflorus TaxID=104777 RepID=A0A813ZGX2_9BILA|nr:unnamed protein product [Brachionus calyciflorus]